MLTDKAVVARAPPPPVKTPGWGTPWGGNNGRAGFVRISKGGRVPINTGGMTSGGIIGGSVVATTIKYTLMHELVLCLL